MLLPNHSPLELLRAERSPRLDAEGFPTRSPERWSDPRPCQWRTDRFDASARLGGEATTTERWRILIEWDEAALGCERLRIQGKVLRVLEARPLRAVRKILFIAQP